MKSISPFQYNRWETDDLHLIWLPPKFNDWEKKKCVYLTGARGSGKTTLLRGFEWFQRLKNESLISQLGKDPFEKKYIGVYLNMPDYVTEQFLDWPQKKESMTEIQIEEERGRLFALYIEYQSLQLLIKAIQTLRGEGIFNYSPEQEEKIVREILQERPEIVKYN
jgi:predicted AAA+ superfamily ATPase